MWYAQEGNAGNQVNYNLDNDKNTERCRKSKKPQEQVSANGKTL